VIITPIVQFTLLIPVKGKRREFNFLKRGVEQFDGNTTDDRGERYYFKLVKERDQWIFADAMLPEWLRDCQESVAVAIDGPRSA
jgi:hypothetical protein